MRLRETLSRRTVAETSIACRTDDRFTSCASARPSGSRILCVCLDDLAYQPVAYDVGVGEVVKADSVDPRQNSFDLHQAGVLTFRQVDLGFVAGDHRLRVNTEAREKHLH